MKFVFEYDPQKSAINKAKHGIDFEDAQRLWSGRFFEVAAKVTDGEMRYAHIGKIGDRYWTAVVSYRGNDLRIISVYPSNSRQIEYYEFSSRSKR